MERSRGVAREQKSRGAELQCAQGELGECGGAENQGKCGEEWRSSVERRSSGGEESSTMEEKRSSLEEGGWWQGVEVPQKLMELEATDNMLEVPITMASKHRVGGGEVEARRTHTGSQPLPSPSRRPP